MEECYAYYDAENRIIGCIMKNLAMSKNFNAIKGV